MEGGGWWTSECVVFSRYPMLAGVIRCPASLTMSDVHSAYGWCFALSGEVRLEECYLRYCCPLVVFFSLSLCFLE